MLSSIYFFAFFTVVMIVYWMIPNRFAKTLTLTLASMVFIYYHNADSLLFLIGISIATYILGRLIHCSTRPKIYHRLGVVLLILALGLTKYLESIWGVINSILVGVNQGDLPSLYDMIVPLGVSYVVFKYISYLTDIYWKLVEPGAFLDFLCYGSLFSIFFAGPIERFERFKPQIESAANIDSDSVIFGYSRIIQGVFKKYIIVNWLFVNIISAGIAGTGYIGYLIYVIAYSIFIYIDFSSYSDIAIGSSALLGIRIRENFNSPYAALNISDFWRRWHISLSEWIRDYLFFPISRWSSNISWQVFWVPVVSMAICGFWHGPGWKFAGWGILHGLLIFFYQWKGKKIAKVTLGNKSGSSVVANFILMPIIFVSWYFFYPSTSSASSDFRISFLTLSAVLGLLSLVMFVSYFRAGIIKLNAGYLSGIVKENQIMFHTLLLLATIFFGVFNTDNTFVYVDF